MSSQELTPEAQKALQTVEKLMRLAGKNTNQHEAASATAKAMALLAEYNLDMSILEQGGGEKAVRTDEKMTGGLYKYQRALWEAVAELNYCFYWNQYTYDPEKKRKGKDRWGDPKSKGGYTFQHRVVGRKVNVVATKNMAQYLEATIERLTRARLNGDGTQFFTKWAIAFREGIADEVIYKVYEERQKMLDADKRRRMEDERRAKQATKAGASTSTALSLDTIAKSEHDANCDFMWGEGWSARQHAARAEAARKQAEADAEYTKWAEANPEEAAAEEKKRREERRKRHRTSWNAGTGRSAQDERKDSGAYWSGREAGKAVSLNPQTESNAKQEKIAHVKK